MIKGFLYPPPGKSTYFLAHPMYDLGFGIPRLWIPDSRYWILDPLSVELELQIQIVKGIPDSKAQNSGSHMHIQILQVSESNNTISKEVPLKTCFYRSLQNCIAKAILKVYTTLVIEHCV